MVITKPLSGLSPSGNGVAERETCPGDGSSCSCYCNDFRHTGMRSSFCGASDRLICQLSAWLLSWRKFSFHGHSEDGSSPYLQEPPISNINDCLTIANIFNEGGGCMIWLHHPEWMWSLMNASLFFVLLKPYGLSRVTELMTTPGARAALSFSPGPKPSSVSRMSRLRGSMTHISRIPLQVVPLNVRQPHQSAFDHMRCQFFVSNTGQMIVLTSIVV